SGTTACVAELQVSVSSALCVYLTAPAFCQSPWPSCSTSPFSVNFTSSPSCKDDGSCAASASKYASIVVFSSSRVHAALSASPASLVPSSMVLPASWFVIGLALPPVPAVEPPLPAAGAPPAPTVASAPPLPLVALPDEPAVVPAAAVPPVPAAALVDGCW